MECSIPPAGSTPLRAQKYVLGIGWNNQPALRLSLGLMKAPATKILECRAPRGFERCRNGHPSEPAIDLHGLRGDRNVCFQNRTNQLVR